MYQLPCSRVAATRLPKGQWQSQSQLLFCIFRDRRDNLPNFYLHLLQTKTIANIKIPQEFVTPVAVTTNKLLNNRKSNKQEVSMNSIGR